MANNKTLIYSGEGKAAGCLYTQSIQLARYNNSSVSLMRSLGMVSNIDDVYRLSKLNRDELHDAFVKLYCSNSSMGFPDGLLKTQAETFWKESYKKYGWHQWIDDVYPMEAWAAGCIILTENGVEIDEKAYIEHFNVYLDDDDLKTFNELQNAVDTINKVFGKCYSRNNIHHLLIINDDHMSIRLKVITPEKLQALRANRNKSFVDLEAVRPADDKWIIASKEKAAKAEAEKKAAFDKKIAELRKKVIKEYSTKYRKLDYDCDKDEIDKLVARELFIEAQHNWEEGLLKAEYGGISRK